MLVGVSWTPCTFLLEFSFFHNFLYYSLANHKSFISLDCQKYEIFSCPTCGFISNGISVHSIQFIQFCYAPHIYFPFN